MAFESLPEDEIDVPAVNKTSRQTHVPSLITTIEAEKPPSIIAETSTKIKAKKDKSQQDNSGTTVIGPELSTRVELQGQSQRKKLRSHGADICGAQESSGPSVERAKDKRAKRKRADSIRREEEDAAQPPKAKVSVKSSIWPSRNIGVERTFQSAKHRNRAAERDEPSPTPTPKTTIEKSRKRRRVAEDSESEPEADRTDTKAKTGPLVVPLSAAAQAKTRGQRAGSKLSRGKDKDDTRLDDTTTTHSKSSSVSLPHQPSSSTAPPSSRPRREASSRMQRDGAYSDKARYSELLGGPGRKPSARRVASDPDKSSSSMPPPDTPASRPARPPAATSSNETTDRLLTPSSLTPLADRPHLQSASSGSRFMRTPLGTQTGRFSGGRTTSASEGQTAATSGMGKQKAVEAPVSKPTMNLPLNATPKSKLPDFKKKPGLGKNNSNTIDAQVTPNDSPSTTATGSGGSRSLAEPGAVPRTSEWSPTVHSPSSESPVPWPVSCDASVSGTPLSQLPRPTQHISQPSDERRVSERLDSGGGGTVIAPQDIVPLPEDQSLETTASRSRTQTVRSAKASVSPDKPSKQELAESDREPSLPPVSPEEAKDPEVNTFEPRSQPGPCQTAKSAGVYASESSESARMRNTEAYLQEISKTAKVVKSLSMRSKKAPQANEDLSAESAPAVEMRPILSGSSTNPEISTVSETDYGCERELINNLLDGTSDSVRNDPCRRRVYSNAESSLTPFAFSLHRIPMHPFHFQ